MIKKDLGQLGFPFYDQKTDSGVSLIFVPRKSHLKSAVVYVNYGGYYKAEEVNGVKTPFGSAYYLEHMLMSDSFKADLANKGILGYSHTDYSFSYYGIDTLGDLYQGLASLMDRITFGKFTEKDVETFRKKQENEARKRENDPVFVAERMTMDNLYLSSPMKKGIVPTPDQAKTIHASGLREFLKSYYTPERIVIMVSMDDTPKHFMEEYEKLHLPMTALVQEKPFAYQEIYDKVNCEYSEMKSPASYSVLSYGVKMPARKELYENYGQMLFSLYEVMGKVLFEENPNFLRGLDKTHSELLNVHLYQGFEDACLLLNVRTDEEKDTVSFITNYLSNVSKFVSKSDYHKVLEQYFASSVSDIAVPSSALRGFSLAIANNMPYTGLIGQTMKMSYSYLKGYLADFQTFRRAASYLRKA